MKSSGNYTEYYSKNSKSMGGDHMKIDRALNILLTEKQLTKAEVIARSGIETHYAYQIFSGLKSPTRDKVLMLCVGFGLTVEETQQLLKITGYAQLYGKNERDNVILFGITKGLTMIEINDVLFEMGQELLL